MICSVQGLGQIHAMPKTFPTIETHSFTMSRGLWTSTAESIPYAILAIITANKTRYSASLDNRGLNNKVAPISGCSPLAKPKGRAAFKRALAYNSTLTPFNGGPLSRALKPVQAPASVNGTKKTQNQQLSSLCHYHIWEGGEVIN